MTIPLTARTIAAQCRQGERGPTRPLFFRSSVTGAAWESALLLLLLFFTEIFLYGTRIEVPLMPTLNIPFANDPEVLSLICQPDIRLRTQNSLRFSELRGCVKVEAAVLGCPTSNSPCGLCGRRATLNSRVLSLKPGIT